MSFFLELNESDSHGYKLCAYAQYQDMSGIATIWLGGSICNRAPQLFLDDEATYSLPKYHLIERKKLPGVQQEKDSKCPSVLGNPK